MPKRIEDELPDTLQALRLYIAYCKKEIKSFASRRVVLERRIVVAEDKIRRIEHAE
jgi:hypothetical protein